MHEGLASAAICWVHGSKKKTMTKRGSLTNDASASNTSSGHPRTAIVTGASQGIGADLVTRFLEKGYNVVGNSRAISASTNLTPSPRLALVDGDIGDCATAQKITDTAIARFGRIDVLVNNAGLLIAKPVGAGVDVTVDAGKSILRLTV
jgi:NAD(P)-dependent dehydrogenase (short-subunit alcohol dehydrogenase family)